MEEYVVSEDVDEVVLSIRDLKFGERSVEFRAIFVYMVSVSAQSVPITLCLLLFASLFSEHDLCHGTGIARTGPHQ